MSNSQIDLMQGGLLAITRDSITALRAALMRDTGYAAAAYLQDAGYAGGGALFEAFRNWLAARGLGMPEDLPIGDFQKASSEFFEDCGWGTLSIGHLDETVITLDSNDWGEAVPDSGMEYPCCHLSSGMFADFFGRVADAPIAVMEVECRSSGHPRCRFLLGSVEVLQELYDGMSGGLSYEEAVTAAA